MKLDPRKLFEAFGLDIELARETIAKKRARNEAEIASMKQTTTATVEDEVTLFGVVELYRGFKGGDMAFMRAHPDVAELMLLVGINTIELWAGEVALRSVEKAFAEKVAETKIEVDPSVDAEPVIPTAQ